MVNYFELADELCKRVLDRFNKDVVSIVLFGSIARQNHKERADIDLIVIMKNHNYSLKDVL